MREHLQRWIRASIAKHFQAHITAALGTDQFLMYMEGMPKHRFYTKFTIDGQPALDVPQDNFFELRVDGPIMEEMSKNYWYILTEVNILICVYVGPDLYKMDRHCGIVQSGFDRCITVTKVGDGDAYVGCMTLAMDPVARQKLVVSNFGQIHPVIPILQSSIEGHYEAHWSL